MMRKKWLRKLPPPPVATPHPPKYGIVNQIELWVPLTHEVHQPTRMIVHYMGLMGAVGATKG